MSGPYRSKLPLALTRQQKNQTAVVAFLNQNGDYTTARRQTAIKLLGSLKSNAREFYKIDEDWTTYIQSLADETEAKNEQALYEKHAVEDPSATKVPYMQVLQDIEEAIVDVETELTMMESAAVAAAQLNSSNSMLSSGGGGNQVLILNAPSSETKKRLFSGSTTEYKAFIADFEASVGSKASIPNVTKLAFLKERLDGEAYNCIKPYNTNDGYQKALDKLKQRFGKDSDAVAEIRRKLKSYVRNKEDLNEVRKAFDEFEYLITTLETYGENIESSEFAEILKSKLSKEVLIRVADYERTTPVGTTFNVTELRKAVDAILSDFERIDKLTGAASRYSKFRKGKPSSPVKTVATNAKNDGKKTSKSKNPSKPADSSTSKSARDCAFCEGPHFADDCPVDKTVEDAKACAASKNLCFKCFRAGHKSHKCKIKVKCRKCDGAHHTVYCNAEASSKRGGTKSSDVPVVAASHANRNSPDTEILLLANEVTVSNPHNPAKRQKVLVFIDPGSQLDLIDEELSVALNLPMTKKAVDCQGATGQMFTASGSYSLNLHLQDGAIYPVNAMGTQQMLTKLSVPDVDVAQLLKNAQTKKEPIPVKNGNPKLLLSMKAFTELVLNQRVVEVGSGFSVIYSKIGQLICGKGMVKRYFNRPTSPVVATFTCPNEDKDVQETPDVHDATFHHTVDGEKELGEVEDATPVVAQVNEYDFTKDPRFLWELELMGIMDNPNADEKRLFLQRFLEKVFQDDQGRIFTALPFEDETGLGSNYANCYRRCAALSKRMLKDPKFAHLYKGCVDEFHAKGFTEEMDQSVINEPGTHFMPHSVVITPGKTTKARLVFDGSCLTERGVSLNQKLLVGDNRLPSLVGILLRARVAPLVVCSDVEKAFLQIYLVEESRKYVRFIFPKDVNKPLSPDNMIIYQFKVVPFGLGCSSNLLAHAIEYHLKRYAGRKVDFAKILEAVLYSLYVDNLALASATPEEAIAQNECVKVAFAAGHMNLRGQISTDPEVNKYFNETAESFNFLGHELIIKEDALVIGWTKLDAEKVPKTKRALLSFCASLFDLMGILEPVRLPIKLLIRQAWSQKLNWNSIMDAKMIEDVTRLYEERVKFNVQFGRRIFQNSNPKSVEMHIFGDACGYAYGCVAYLRYIDDQGEVQCGLIFAKSRLAPLKPVMTITKLELTGTALCSHVGTMLKEELGKVLDIDRVVFWTDSTTVLYWINDPEGKGRYVTNRVLKLRQAEAEFKHVTGILNPADVVSRGCSPAEFKLNETWFTGPAFLCADEALWPPQPDLAEKQDAEEALIVAALTAASVSSNEIIIDAQIPLIDASKINSWITLRGVAVNVLKFLIQKSSLFAVKMFGCTDPHEVDIVKKAELMLISHIQHAVQLHKHRVDELGLYLLDGRWRKYCRVKAGADPLYLSDCAETRLLVLHIHEQLNHGSVAMVLGELNQLYYLPKARAVIKSVLRSHCMICRKMKAVPYALPIMNDMPLARTFGKPFESTGVDLAGPVKIQTGTDEAVSHWIVLFTCFSSRAVHLELVDSLSGAAFIDALIRFASRRGMPSFIYSDNGTNLKVTAATIIPKWINQADPDVLDYCTSKKIKWKFNTEKTPWAGGIYETMIKLLKRNLKFAVGRSQMTFWKMLTLLAQVESWVNSRPLTYISDDANQLILRPVDFLTPFIKPGVPEMEVDVADPDFTGGTAHENLISMWSQGQKRFLKFKESFNKDYLTMLRDRTRHHQQSGHVVYRDPRVGEVVSIHDEDEKVFWKMGIIVELVESSDKRIRAAKVQTASGKILQRPISHLYPLEIDDYSMKNVSQPVKGSTLPKLQLQAPSAYERCKELPAEFQEDENVEDVCTPKIHPMTTRQDRRKNTVGSVLLMNPLLLFICCLISCFCSGWAKPCPAGATVERVYHTSCVRLGYVVQRYEGGYCWLRKVCDKGSFMPVKFEPDGELCAAGICACPSWAQGCSHQPAPMNLGNSTIKNSKIHRILSSMKPGYCSIEPSSKCSANHMKMKFIQIQLLDGTLHYVNDLHIIHQEAHDESFKCFGDGTNNDADGPDEYCAVPEHVCNTDSSKVCVPTFVERTYAMTNEGNIEIQAWGMVTVMVYGALEEDQIQWNTSCAGGQLMVDHVEVNDVLQLEYLKTTDYVKAQSKNVVVQIPRQLLMVDQNVSLTLWRKGNIVATTVQECLKEDYCRHIDCFFCPELLANYHCRTWGLLVLLVVLIISFALTIIEMIYFLLRKQRGERAYWLKRLCRKNVATGYEHKKFEDPVQIEVVHHTPGGGHVRYQGIHTVQISMTVTILAVVLLAFVHPGEAASASISFQAKNNLCITSASGMKSCQHNNIAHFTIKDANQIAMNLQDDEGRPQTSLILDVTPVAKCQRSSSKFTRLAEIQVYSSKRCPSKGSCIDSVCEDVQPNTTIAELALVNDHPGVTRCTSSCGCWGCGCFLCYDGCTFYRYYATSLDPRIYESFSCRKWIFGAEVRMEQRSSHKSEVKEFYLEQGTSTKFNQMVISLPAVRTSEVVVQRSFVHDGHRIAFGDGVTDAAMNLLQCPTKAAAEKFDCNLNENACNCLAAGTGVNCLCAQNQVLKRHLDHSSLPDEKIQIKLKEAYAYYQLEDAVTDLVVETQHMEVVSQIDYNACNILNSSVQGCVNCVGGAFVFVSCVSDFGKSLAFVECPPFSFSVLCDSRNHVLTLDLNDTQVNLNCLLKCPANAVHFNISGTLNFVNNNYHTVKTTKATVEVHWIDAAMSFIEGLINSSNYLFIIIILIVIVLLK